MWYNKTMTYLSESEDSVTLNRGVSHRNAPVTLSKDFLDLLLNTKVSKYDLETLLWFRAVTRNTENYYWSTPEEELGKDLTGWDLHYFESNWEDSCWSEVPSVIRFEKESNEVETTPERTYYTLQTEEDDNEPYNYHFYSNEEILLVKTPADVAAARSISYAKDKTEQKLWAEAEETGDTSKLSAEKRELFEQINRPRDESVNPLANELLEWEKELLGGFSSEESPEVE